MQDSPIPQDPQDYVLGTDEAELHRLGLQHRLWSAQAFDAWERAAFRLGQHLLDVGCGPGHATFDLAQLVGPAGRVVAVDASERFIRHLAAQSAARGLHHVDPRVADVQNLDLPPDSLDGAFTRWVLCFVPDPEAVVRSVARALRPKAAFVVHDYVNYHQMLLAPRSDAFHTAVRAVDRAWRASGGDPDVAQRLPGIFDRCGLRVADVRPLTRVARPHTPLWQWPTTFFSIFLPKLVESGVLTAAEKAAFDRDWADRSRDPNAYFVTPPMLEIIGVKH